MNSDSYLKDVKRVVVKVGTSLLVVQGDREERDYFRRLLTAIRGLRRGGRQVLLVSSGAIGMGLRAVGLKKKPLDIPRQQALAAIGQNRLMSAYQEAAAGLDMLVGQVLLVYDDIMDRERYTNARHALEEMLNYKVLPIINENDTVAVDELKFGDNDRLSALVASMMEADLLVILSDVDGLYDRNPRQGGRRLIVEVEKVDERIMAMAAGKGSEVSTGGMASKLGAVQVVAAGGCAAVIAAGKDPEVLARIMVGERVGTFFRPSGRRVAGRKRWIAHALRTRGILTVDEGARRAIVEGGKSLLPSGIIEVEGGFRAGEAVVVLDRDKQELARGLVRYSALEIDKIKGQRTAVIAGLLGYKGGDEVIHRDDLVISI